MMDDGEDNEGYKKQLGINDPRDTVIQIVLSLVLGFAAFIAFCILRTKWPGLYSARKRRRDEAAPLPDLPDTFFGWIPALWRITEQQVLASAGLDAYVFLRFFKLAIKFLAVTLFFALVVIKPVHDAFPDSDDSIGRNHTNHDKPQDLVPRSDGSDDAVSTAAKNFYDKLPTDFLWMYIIFAYVFTAIAIYLLVTETVRIISVRQEFLGSQSTVTDRTIRLSGIPHALRSEEKIKDFIEGLQIGKVETVLLCRDWKALDDLMSRRRQLLRKLEESWTVYLGKRSIERSPESLPVSQPPPPRMAPNDEEEGESGRLLDTGDDENALKARPQATIRYGFLKLRSKHIDAIDYYQEKLRKIDEEIKEKRKQEFKATPLAFVTMDSVAACQMAVQAVLDPNPMTLIAKLSPAPQDIVWPNTYMARSHRMTRGWIITLSIFVLTIFWSIVLVPIAGILNLESIKKVWPQLADALSRHPFARSLVKTQLPTLLSTLLFVAVPYLYDWLANFQGMISQSDIELSVISKNFFFVFFNYFVVFTVLGTASNFYKFFENFRDSLKDTTKIAYTLARSLQSLQAFYTNLIILQGVGLFPFRLLEFGSVSLYPIYRIGAKTPRDYAELLEPPVFNFGFYMPQVMLIFIICIVYSILRESWKVILAGLIYFTLGGFVYKYQLLYAMEHLQSSTGRAWVMICGRMIVGLLLFQLTTAGQLALKGAFKRAIAILPLLVVTFWFSYYYRRHYKPLMEYISLRTIDRTTLSAGSSVVDPDGWGEEQGQQYESNSHPGHVLDPSKEFRDRFVNPNTVAPLEDVWIDEDAAEVRATEAPESRRRLESALNAMW